jgi:hypothetical protein
MSLGDIFWSLHSARAGQQMLTLPPERRSVG